MHIGARRTSRFLRCLCRRLRSGSGQPCFVDEHRVLSQLLGFFGRSSDLALNGDCSHPPLPLTDSIAQRGHSPHLPPCPRAPLCPSPCLPPPPCPRDLPPPPPCLIATYSYNLLEGYFTRRDLVLDSVHSTGLVRVSPAPPCDTTLHCGATRLLVADRRGPPSDSF